MVLSRELDFLAIVAGAGAVDDEEVAFGEDEQEVVPDALAVVDALVRLRAEEANPGGIEGARGGHSDEVGLSAQRDEGLAAERMALEDPKDQFGKRAGPAESWRERSGFVCPCCCDVGSGLPGVQQILTGCHVGVQGLGEGQERVVHGLVTDLAFAEPMQRVRTGRRRPGSLRQLFQ